MISTAIVCLTAIIITVLIIKYLKFSHVSHESIQRMDARYNELYGNYQELSNKFIALDVDKMQADYKVIKESMATVNQQITQVNTKLAFSSQRHQVLNNGQ